MLPAQADPVRGGCGRYRRHAVRPRSSVHRSCSSRSLLVPAWPAPATTPRPRSTPSPRRRHTTNTTVDRPTHQYITEIATAKVPAGAGLPRPSRAQRRDHHHRHRRHLGPPGRLPPSRGPGSTSVGVAVEPDGYAYSNPTYFNNPLVFDVVHDDGDWLQVSLLARPNHQMGWIRRADVTLSTTEYQHRAHACRTSTCRPSTATSCGRDPGGGGPAVHAHPARPFFLTEKIARPAGRCLRALDPGHQRLLRDARQLRRRAARRSPSTAPTDPQLSAPGRSNGCIRMPDAVDLQAGRDLLPAGTPITIQA